MKKILLFLFLTLFGIVGVSAVTDEDLKAGSLLYYTLDNDFISGTTIIDSVGNYNGTNNGATCGVTGQINKSCDFDGVNDYVTTTSDINLSNNWTISTWINPDVVDSGDFFVGIGYNPNENERVGIGFDASNKIRVFQNPSGNVATSTTTIGIGTWYQVLATSNNGAVTLYINGVLEDTTTFNEVAIDPIIFGSLAENINFFNGKMDEIFVKNQSMNSSEVQELYNRQLNATIGSQYDFTSLFPRLQFENISVNNQTLINDTFFNTTELNFSTEVLNISTNGNVNQTYFLYYNGALNQTSQFATNNVNGSFQLNLNEGLYDIYFYAENNQTNVTSQNYTFSVDITPPTINNSIPTEITSYFFEANQFSCDNSIICNITINNQTLNTTQNTTLTLNGNLSYTILAEDLAGNTATETGTLFVNPFVYFYFDNSVTNNSISNYQVGGFQVNGTEYKRKYFDLFTNINQTFTFTKNGYVTTDFDVIMLNNQTINETFNIQPVNLFVRVFDGETLQPITFNLTIENSQITSYQNLNVFNQSFPNIPIGDIKLIINSQNYSQAVYYTTIQTNTSTTFDVYLTPEDLTSVITFNVRDFSTNNLLGDVLIEARRIINDSRVTVQQTQTDGNGLAYLYLDGLKDYEFVFSRNGYVTNTIDSIPGVTTYTVKLTSDSTTYTYIDDVSYRFSPGGAALYGGTNVTFKGFISSKSLTQSRLVIVDNFGNTLFNQTSINPLGTQFEFTQEFLNNTNISKVTMTLSYIINGVNKEVNKEYSVFSLSNSGVEDFMDFGNENSEQNRLLRFFIIITTFATFIILGGRNQTTRDFVSLITLIPLFIFAFVGWIPYLYATVMALILIVLFMGGNKR